jgi:hypothetical protein
MKLRTLQGWALLVNAIIGLIDIATIVTGGTTDLLVVDEVFALLFLFGLPAIQALQPQTGRLGKVGLWCLGIAAGIAFVVMLVFHFSTWQVNTLIPLSSALFFLVGSVVVGAVTIRAQVFPAAIGWLLIVGGVLNLVSGMVPAGLLATMLGVIGVLTQTGAFAGYGWIIIRRPLRREEATQPAMDQTASQSG